MELKSYLTDAVRAELIAAHADEALMNMEESKAAAEADDMDTAWRWLGKNDLPDYTLKLLKQSRGADFIRKYGFNTVNADKSYGENWLNE
ncbi:hypothetical protein F9B74_05840 [Pelistega sp. NLN82]|uniref:Uncharacterized protein n=1 Tax=Pelistega ratti TaxID=2652177 RepID=A0A6L9Y6D8_9BURK|nr:hypothetical protein [Pelistega ratti]NEN75846.1 hypothetical protein [Pelistega ratti]